MTDVIIAGIGQTPVGEHWGISLRTLAARAIQAARRDAGGLKPQALYIGNLLAATAQHQTNLGSLLATNCGLEGIEAFTVEASDASGAAAMRLAYLAVLSGYVDVAMAVGVEKCSDLPDAERERVIAETMDYDFESVPGLTLTSQAGLLMQRYLHESGAPRTALAGFPILAHANALNNPNAMYHRAVDLKAYEKAAMLSAPLNMLDMASYADGAAAVLVTRRDLLPKDINHPLVRITASSMVTDTLALHDRHDPLKFEAAGLSAGRACSQAGILPAKDLDFFELHDAFSIYAVLSLEAAGVAAPGQGWRLAQGDDLKAGGRLPINTMGGLKGRGNPLGAAGIYQVVEAALQLRGQAGANQIPDARRGLVQTLGGPAATAVTHMLERYE